MIGINETFPAFEMTGVDKNNELIKINSADYSDKWSVFFFYPKDFTFICPTEIFAMDKISEKGYNVLGFSGDNEYCKLNWTNKQFN